MFHTSWRFCTRLLFACGLVVLVIFVCFIQGCGASRKVQTTNQPSCSEDQDTCPGNEQFYRNRLVRECLRFEQQNLVNENQTCWAELNEKIRSDPSFAVREKLTDLDLAKIRQKAALSDQVSSQLEQELQACGRLPPNKRNLQIACYQDYLKNHNDQLSRAERLEAEQSLALLQQSGDRAAGAQEDTIEHAGKLLGLQLHAEEDGIRIDSVLEGPLASVGLSEQDLLITIDGVRLTELSASEAIAGLEACRERPIRLLFRHGGLSEVRFTMVETICVKDRRAERLSQATLPPITCSNPASQEFNLGFSLCYLANEGVLEVKEVCQGSPALEAGVLPGHRYEAIDNTHLLGKSYTDIQNWIKANPTPLFEGSGGVLHSPLRLKATWSDPKQLERCKAALRTTLKTPVEKPSEP
jgi:hypothetical protein